MKYNKDYIRIENLSQFLIPKIKQYHPDDPRHTRYWAKMMKYCIEGLWGREFGKYRYMPGRLFFYGNFCTILDVDEEQNTRKKIKPDIRDIEWERAYGLLEAEGFSGWSEDERFTSDVAVFDPEKVKNTRKRYLALFNSEGKLKEYMPVRENIRKLHDKPMGVPLYWNSAKNFIELGCLDKDVEVRMFDGSVKKAKNIKVGDKLMGVDSTPRTVQKLVRGTAMMYDVHTRYGETYRTSDSHLHYVRKQCTKNAHRKDRTRYWKYLTLDTSELLEINPKSLVRDYEAVIQGVEYEKQDLKINPYFIGYWLGDGFQHEKMVCYNEDDREFIEPHLTKLLTDEGATVMVKNHGPCGLGNKDMYRLWFRRDDLKHKGNYWSKTFLRNKHIPNNYLISSRNQRLQLLAGMIDADGSYERGRYRIWNCDKSLILQFQELARSLGFKAKLHKEQIGGIKKSTKYILAITGEISQIPCVYPRKKAEDTNNQGSNKNNIVVDVQSGKVDNFYGFEVDKDHLFLLKDYTVTHNARGGGKSYFWSLACVKYEVCFDGVKYYTEENILNPPKAETCVGAGQQNKSSEFVKKIADSMNMLAVDNSLGAWGKPGDPDYEPSPLFKEMAGSINPNNKDNLWRHEYKVIENGRELIKGTGSYVAHVVYSIQKRDGAEAAAGGRYSKLIYEEIGLLELLTKAWGSNKSTVRIGTSQFGCQIGLGTSGNMDTIVAAKEIFTHPEQYNVVSYNDVWEESGEIGFFLPAYMTAREFKDKNGNTDFDAAIAEYKRLREIAAKADNPHILAIEKMNAPLVPSDMWQTTKGNILPVNEAEAREKELNKNRLYQKIGTPVELIWNSNFPNGVEHKVDNKRQPFYEHKYRHDRDTLDAPIMIYEFPQEINGAVPNDMYKFVGHDPYVSDAMDEGDSLGALYMIMNPKYVSEGFNGNTIVASYVAKTPNGRKEYYENVEKLLAFYGNPIRGLWFEANRGDECKNYFKNKDKEYLLCLRPQRVQDSNIYQRRVAQYGYIVGSKVGKIDLLDKTAEWLLEETTLSDGTKRNIERIPCKMLLQQIQQFNMDSGNYDCVMALVGCVLGMREEEYLLIQEIENKNKHNPLVFLSQNANKFKQPDPLDSLRKRLDRFQKDEPEERVVVNFNDKWNNLKHLN